MSFSISADTLHPERAPIGVFDSGVGGLTVASAIRRRLPAEALTYLGDTARVPYGNRGAQTIQRYSVNATSLLVDEGIKALVIACNTASAHAMDAIRAQTALPILGVIEPVAEQAAAMTETGHVAVLGTRATISSGGYERALKANNPDLTVHALPCPLFVPLAEEGWRDGPIVEAIARTYLEPLASTQVDTLILGCTHYPLLRATIGLVLDSIMPRHVRLLDSAEATARALESLLTTHTLATDTPAPERGSAPLRFLVTDDPSRFMSSASLFFEGRLARAEHVDIPAR